MKVPFLSFGETNKEIRDELLAAFANFFDESWYILGNSVRKFEEEYAAFNGVEHCIGTSNGLDALHLALLSAGVGKGDEVIVPSNTFIATLLAVSYVGARPILVEPDDNLYTIDVNKLEHVVTTRTKAIIPVHLYGQACNMVEIMLFAKKNGLMVVEDNAQAQGAKWDGRLTGSWGHINATSFYPGKNLGALGDAGAITTNDHILASSARRLRNYGSELKYVHEVVGYNMRLDECQAAFLSIKLKRLNEWTNKRTDIAALYNEVLKDTGDLILPQVHSKATHVYHLYVVRTNRRDELQKHLSAAGIGTLIHYPIPPHLQKAYAHLQYRRGDFPIAERLADTCLSLPLWPGMTQSTVEFVGETIKRFYR
ncbi:MAG TPA: DegT/DnrJ/EryC1/StrS family aminotransferase [Cyclobacteriaceae bacterium]|nr:DegT/DnrJ/EryC1/StrS family aminotransferase [Cyclobacteriaceae bacterium]